MSKQQTAVEWLIMQLPVKIRVELYEQNIHEQAKQIEKEQHQETFKHSRQAKIFEDNKPPVWKSFDEYYNETFNNK